MLSSFISCSARLSLTIYHFVVEFIAPAATEATFKCGKKSQIMRYRTCRKWRNVRLCAVEFFELCGKCAVNLIELCDYNAVNYGIVQKICGI